MTKTVTATWNFDLEAGKDKGIVLLLGINNDGTKGIGYCLWDNIDKVSNSAATLEQMPNVPPKALKLEAGRILEV